MPLTNLTLQSLTPEFFLISGFTLVVSIIVAKMTAASAAERWNGNKVKVDFICSIIMAAFTIACIIRFGVAMKTMQGIILCAALLYASYGDIKVREGDDFIYCIILTASLIGKDMTAIPGMVISAGIMFGFLALVAVISKGGGFGGADIKLTAALTFMFGLMNSMFLFAVGMLLGILCNLKKDKEAGFPAFPYLSIPYTIAFLFL